MRTIWIPHSVIPNEQQREGTATPDAIAHSLLDVFTIVESWQ
jgi:putative hydrolase of the HAD superfamily